MASKIEQDTVASVHYTGTFLDGEEFDSSEGKEPLAFLVGHNQMIPGFEREMMGAEAGDKREFTLTPDQAYGERDESRVQKATKAEFGEMADSLEVGAGPFGAQTEMGMIPFWIGGIEGDDVIIDFNNPMAGKTLQFAVEVMGVRAATADEMSHGHSHGPGGHSHEEKSSGCGDPNCCS